MYEALCVVVFRSLVFQNWHVGVEQARRAFPFVDVMIMIRRVQNIIFLAPFFSCRRIDTIQYSNSHTITPKHTKAHHSIAYYTLIYISTRYTMDRLDFLSSLPFLAPCEDVFHSQHQHYRNSNTSSQKQKTASLPWKKHAASADLSSMPQRVLLSIEAYGKINHASSNIDQDADTEVLPILGPIYFQDKHSDPALTVVDLSMPNHEASVTTADFFNHTMLILTIDPNNTIDMQQQEKQCHASEHHHHHQDSSMEDSAAHFRFIRPPRTTTMIAATNNTPASLLLRYEACALRFFLPHHHNNQEKDNNKESIAPLQQFFAMWQNDPPMRRASLSASPRATAVPPTNQAAAATASSPSTMESPPAAQTTHPSSSSSSTNSTPLPPRAAKRARKVQVYRDTTTHLRNLRALLLQPSAKFLLQQPATSSSSQSMASASTTSTVVPSPKTLLQNLRLDGLYTPHDSHDLYHHQQTLLAKEAVTHQALRQAVEAYFPVVTRRRGAKTSATPNAPSQQEMLPQVRALLQQQQEVVRQRHVASILTFARGGARFS